MKRYIILDGDPKNAPNKQYLTLVKNTDWSGLFCLIQNNFLNEKQEILLTKDEILKMAEFVKEEEAK